MYSYEQRKVAIELYIKYDFQVNPVIKELGYPSRRILYKWYKEYLKQQGFPNKHMKKSIYSDEQKTSAIQYYFDHGKSLANTIRMLGYPTRMTLRAWIDEVSLVSTKRCDTNKYLVRYSVEEKKKAVYELCERNTSAENIAKSHKVPRSTLYQWKKQLLGDDEKGVAMYQKHTSTYKTESSNKNSLNMQKDDLEKQVNRLKKEVFQLQLEHDILLKSTEILKKEMSIDPRNLPNREKAILIDALKKKYALNVLLHSLDMARSSYFYHMKSLKTKGKYEVICRLIKDIFELSRKSYGYRRVYLKLKMHGIRVSEKVVRRIMKENQLIVKTIHKKKYNSYKGEITPAVDNIIKRDFHADRPNTKWLTDITEFHIPAGKVYLSPIIDCFDGMIVTWSLGTSPNANLVNDMLDAAISTLKDFEHPVIHSDRGCHYRWPGWIAKMNKAHLIRSMSEKGCSPDNAACEGFFGRLKNEMFYGRSWLHVTIDEFIKEINSYVHWYNEKRIKISLGGMSPMEYRYSLGLLD